ncbi:MAG: bifunctional enoyl-CoA hydratase/phosphate acetyltransferase [Alphaproteobacteria bacterium]|nr:bifunctional enoyl-CoA hydratase/phosphate acetyltransferase [Alphaproteobacteria bacterium]
MNATSSNRLYSLVEQAKKFPPLKTAVVCPYDAVSLEGMADAAREGIIIPVLVGVEARIRAAAEKNNISISGYEIVPAQDDKSSAVQACALAREGKVGALMKGSLHTDDLMGAVVDRNVGLRTNRRMSHVFAMDVPSYKWPLLITDAALNIAPDLETKRSICQNAIDLAKDLGVAEPKIAILGATELVNPAMPATLEAACLCKMADRGQITGGVLDGPFAIDNAISPEAVKIKGIKSPVAGVADILIMPDIEAGNIIYKGLVYLAASGAAGIVLGGRVPVMLTSRADTPAARLGSAAMAVLTMAGQKARQSSK